MTPKPPDLYLIEEPEAPASNVIHISGIRSHVGAVDPSPVVAPPWPRERSWRDLMRRLAAKPATKDPVR